ncbi:MAG: DUF2868 domain-containing protein [Burkholderiaceae bacterium]
MNETTAREIALVRAIELADRDQQLLHAEDRRQANQAARETSRGQAASSAADVTGNGYLQARAHALLDRLQSRHTVIAAARQAGHWPLWAGLGSALVALVAGGFAERIANPQRVDLLSVALLAIVLWNLVVYLTLLLVPLLLRARKANAHEAWLPVPRWLRHGAERWMAGRSTAAQQPEQPALLRSALLGFARDWNRLAASLNYARIARMLHLAAALFAAGAIASLYLRGIVSEYRVGWESTFLGANAVHGLLSVVFWPVVHLLGMQPFSVDQVAALQFSQPPQPASGARWVHLYAALLALIVVLPRAVLAALAWRRERQLVHTFPLDLQEPYFQRLLAGAGGAVGGGAGPRAGATQAGALSVWPYSFRLNDARRQGLQAVAAQLLGSDAPLDVRAPVGYGEDLPAPDADAPAAALTLLLFNASATPETENHGAFIDQAKAATPRRTAVLLDESGWLERFGQQPDGADRQAERRRLWKRFCQSHGVAIAFVDLLEPMLDGLEHDLAARSPTMAAA